MGHWEYLTLMGACVLITLPLELLFSARVYRRWKILAGSLIPIIVAFSLWDFIAIARGHWTYNPQFVIGIHLGNLPLEELIFFIFIPICALLSYEAVGTVLAFISRKTKDRKDRGDA